jgi:SAM-dependent methyltransferase
MRDLGDAGTELPMRAGTLSALIARQLRHPVGVAGSLVGRAMLLVNREPNAIAINALELHPDDVVLELGFGPRHALGVLSTAVPGGVVFGIDHSTVMLRQASRRNRKAVRDGRLRLQQGCFDALPWPTALFDKILAVNVAYFFREDGAEIAEARRVLRPNGVMAVYSTDEAAMKQWKFADPHTHRLWNRETLAASLARGGFAPDEVEVRPITVKLGIPGLLAIARKSRSFLEDPADRP